MESFKNSFKLLEVINRIENIVLRLGDSNIYIFKKTCIIHTLFLQNIFEQK